MGSTDLVMRALRVRERECECMCVDAYVGGQLGLCVCVCVCVCVCLGSTDSVMRALRVERDDGRGGEGGAGDSDYCRFKHLCLDTCDGGGSSCLRLVCCTASAF